MRKYLTSIIAVVAMMCSTTSISAATFHGGDLESDKCIDTPKGEPIIILSPNYYLANNLYGMDTHHMRMVIKADMKGEKFDKDKRWFYDWEEAGNRRTVAMVTVKMNINYQGRDMEVIETRAYQTESCLSYASGPSNFDRWDLLNRLKMRVTSTSYQESVPEYEP